MHRPLMAVPALQLLHGDVPRMTRRFRNMRGTLRCLIPMAFGARGPGCRQTVRLRRFAIGSENELDEQAVLFDDPELMTILADNIPVT